MPGSSLIERRTEVQEVVAESLLQKTSGDYYTSDELLSQQLVFFIREKQISVIIMCNITCTRFFREP